MFVGLANVVVMWPVGLVTHDSPVFDIPSIQPRPADLSDLCCLVHTWTPPDFSVIDMHHFAADIPAPWPL